MRFIKMLGLAAMASLVAMAFVGVSSAMAEFNTVLCEEAKLECESPVNGGGNVEIHLEALKGNSPWILTSLGTVKCDESLARVTLLNKLEVAPEKQEAHLLALNFTGDCLLGSIRCEITTNEVGGLAILKIGELEASVTGKELEGKKTLFTVKCGSVLNCKYSFGAATELRAQSDAEGHLLFLAQSTPLNGLGFLCPKENYWDATYHAVNLDEGLTLKTGLYIES